MPKTPTMRERVWRSSTPYSRIEAKATSPLQAPENESLGAEIILEKMTFGKAPAEVASSDEVVTQSLTFGEAEQSTLSDTEMFSELFDEQLAVLTYGTDKDVAEVYDPPASIVIERLTLHSSVNADEGSSLEERCYSQTHITGETPEVQSSPATDHSSQATCGYELGDRLHATPQHDEQPGLLTDLCECENETSQEEGEVGGTQISPDIEQTQEDRSGGTRAYPG